MMLLQIGSFLRDALTHNGFLLGRSHTQASQEMKTGGANGSSERYLSRQYRD